MSRSAVLEYSHQYVTDDDEVIGDIDPHRILLIEDNRSDVLLIKRFLRGLAENKEFLFIDVPRMVDALELLDRQRFDLAIVDLHLLDIDGSAAVAAFHGQAPHIPIIVHTSSQCPKLRHEAIMCGASHYLVKGRESPFSFKFMVQQTLFRTEI